MTQQFDPAAMDAAAQAAEKELREFINQGLSEGASAESHNHVEGILWLTGWIRKHYTTAGYKRLGRILKELK